METRALRRRNAPRGIASMAFVAAMHVRKRVELVRQPKRVVGMMEFVGRLRREPTLTMNASIRNVMVLRRVRRRRIC